MSLCYEFEKWTMITLASVAVSLIVGLLLINFVHAEPPYSMPFPPKLVEELDRLPELETILNQCYQHADSPNPVQDLINKGLLEHNYTSGITCAEIKQMREHVKMHMLDFEIRNDIYRECLGNETKTYEQCERIKEAGNKIK